jgi:creatinine amidohydrolase
MSAARLAALTWPEVAARAAASLLLVPVGSTEQHGPHLPLSTDTDLAVELSLRLAARRPDALTAPALSYGSSGEHSAFPGTLSIGQEALELVLVELVRSADAFAGVALVSAHGGNAGPLSRAVARLVAEGRPVRSWAPSEPGGDAHAGFTETSALLAVAPASVHLERAEPGVTEPLETILATLTSSGVAALSPNGVLGDPTGASTAQGESLLERWTGDLELALSGWPTPR